MLNEIQDKIEKLAPEDFKDLQAWVMVIEAKRRESLKAKTEVIVDLQSTGELPKPDVVTEEEASKDVESIPNWVNPFTIHSKMYRKGDVVKHNGKVWISTTPILNSWEPGGVGVYENVWKELTIQAVGETSGGESPYGTPDGTKENPLPWEVGKNYTTGQYITLDGVTYMIVQNLTAMAHYRPGGAGLDALYRRV